jgi:hypothetical protein
MSQPPRCGTPSGYKRHLRHGEEPCQPCKTANTQYALAYRARKPHIQENRREYGKAYQRARQRLIEAHAEEFEALLAEERES